MRIASQPAAMESRFSATTKEPANPRSLSIHDTFGNTLHRAIHLQLQGIMSCLIRISQDSQSAGTALTYQDGSLPDPYLTQSW